MSNNKSHNSKDLQTIKEKIAANFKHPPKIDDLARAAGISKSTLQHEFTLIFGKSIQDYQFELRINAAKVLLEKPDYSVKYVAVVVGYKNPGNFSRGFKKLTGMTPLQYRNDFQLRFA